MAVQDSQPNVQAVRRVLENDTPTEGTPASTRIFHLPYYSDDSSGKDILLWGDILDAFKEDIVHVRSGTIIFPFLKGRDFKNLDPLRIAAVPGATLDIVVRSQLGGKTLSLESLQSALPEAPQENNTAPTSVRRNPVGGLVEVAWENYTHIENPATAPKLRGPQTPRNDQASNDNTTQISNPCSKSDKHLQGPQERSSTADEDFTETVMNARLGYKHAQNALGEMYKDGRGGVLQDYQLAMDWFHKAAAQGLARAQFNIGDLYDYGLGVPQDFSKAMEWFLMAAAQDDPEAQSSIGGLYANGQGVTQDYSQAIDWYLKAANKGLPRAQWSIGNRYYHGQGVSQDYSQAMAWYLKAANQEYAAAQNDVGNLYYSGHGVSQDYSQAMAWYLKAANQGHAVAQTSAASLYYNGLGVPQDYSQAMDWFLKAAENGDSTAKFSVGWLYECGKGVLKNRAAAINWYKKSAAEGSSEAKKALERLEQQQ